MKRFKVLFAYSILSILILSIFTAIPNCSADSGSFIVHQEGYVFTSVPLKISKFTSADGIFPKTNGPNSGSTYSSEGLICNYTGTSKYVQLTDAAKTRVKSAEVILSSDAFETIPSTNQVYMQIRFTDESVSPNKYWIINIRITSERAIYQLRYNAQDGLGEINLGETTPVWYEQIQGVQTYHMAFEVVPGAVNIGFNGMNRSIDCPLVPSSSTYFGYLHVKSGLVWENDKTITLSKLAIYNSQGFHFNDHLKMTLSPYGYDFGISFHLHADATRYEMVDVLREYAITYGVKGTLDVFMESNTEVYGDGVLQNISLLNSLLALKDAGWDIGIHSGAAESRTRSQILELLDAFEDTFGAKPAIWSDHSSNNQDLNKSGNNLYSDYYIADYLQQNEIPAWINNESHAHMDSMFGSLNGIVYEQPGFENLYTFRASAYYFPSLAQFNSDSELMMGLATTGTVNLYHEYPHRFCVVSSGGKLIGSETGPGVTFNGTYYSYPATHYQSGEKWYMHPKHVAWFETAKAYNIWYATAREVVDRSSVFQQLTFLETASGVEITNPAQNDIDGLTLYTRSESKPDYILYSDGTYYYPSKSAVGWAFGINVPKGTILSLEKVEPSNVPQVYLDSVGLSIHRTGDRLFVYALNDGVAHIEPMLNYIDYRITNSKDTLIPFIEGSLEWNTSKGELYEVWSASAYRQELLDAAISPIFAIIPLVIIVSVIPMVMGLGRKLK